MHRVASNNAMHATRACWLALCVLSREDYMSLPKDRIIIASDVNPRDGIGVELYRNDEILVEVFRDDTKRTRTVSLFKDSVSLELVEEAIQKFKDAGLWDFIEYEE